MIEELKEHGYDLSPGTLYPILNNLQEKNYLKSNEKVVNGKKRKYYTTTDAGEKKLEEIKPKIRELVNEVLGE